MDKFGRNYELTVDVVGGSPVVIKMPFTIEFDVQRHRYSSATLSTIRIFNLSETNRRKLRKNQTEYYIQKKVTLRAGYGDNLSTLIIGNVSEGSSVREGNDYITTLQIYDGGYAYENAELSKQYSEKVPYKTIAIDLIKNLKEYGITLGSVGKIEGDSGRGYSVSGPIMSALKEITDNKIFIDNNTAHILNKNEVVPAPLKKITSATGLLGTPVRERTFLTLDVLFEPQIITGQKLEVESLTNKDINNVYVVISLRHRGIISEAVNGDCTTSLVLEYGLGTLTEAERGT